MGYPVFSPDIALASEAEQQLEQLHAVLHQWAKEEGFYWALAIWHGARATLTDNIQQAFNQYLPKPQIVEQFLSSLFDSSERLNKLTTVLKKLPSQALGAWCNAEPFYVLKDNEKVLPDELYLPTACLLNSSIWALLDKANVPLSDMAILLGCSETQALQDKEMRTGFSSIVGIFEDQEKSLPSPAMDKFAELFLSKFSSSSVGYKNPAWQQKTTMTLNWEDVDYLYLLPKTLPSERTPLLKLPKGLWLALGETSTLSDLNDIDQSNNTRNICLTLNKQQVLSLLHTQPSEQAKQALFLLNRFAAPQRRIKDELTFRTEIGLGSLIDKHFYGRDEALLKLNHCLMEADHEDGSGSAALLVAGRRMGKTTLRQRILFELKRDNSKRVYLKFNFEGEATLKDLAGVELEWWFFNELAKRFEACGYPLHVSWTKSNKDSKDVRKTHRDLLRNHLHKLKQQTRHTVLFTFDETEHLIKADAKDNKQPYELFGFFRKLIQDRLLCLIATSYPYGSEVPWALNIAKSDSNSPTHNTFSTFIELKSWSPKTAWDFLASRLAGFGIVLPRYYRNDMLDISRGVLGCRNIA